MDGLDDITNGDEERADALRTALDRLRRSDNPLLREMAAAVRDGQLDLRQAVTGTTYGAELSQPFRTFWTAYQEMTTQERDDLCGARPTR
ncbi:hypothetical protein [Micromonospora sp. AMSO31t]|uniref:hypothetical protein n=1 Tax=Micromonospora sp. AMSO31t TaxID=2650566 RepID=UPI00124B8700|nr:hypothetical protein [Micromonospora sp. AMSO31t]KAB1914346.1 hypothetical protein F8274_07515 [Micromonospora sp. AMSO31t]